MTRKLYIVLLVFLVVFCPVAPAQDSLKLEKITILSRHSVRAPLEQYLQDLDQLVPEGYSWNRWSVEGSHLTLRGAALETLFGEYFRLWLAKEDFTLASSDIYFGASSKQRTIATARSFAAGMLPLMDVPIDYKVKEDGSIGYADPDYLPLLNDHSCAVFDTVAFKNEAYRELGELAAPSYKFLEKILNYKRSPLARSRQDAHFNDAVGVRLDFRGANGKLLEPTMLGDLNLANRACDALILQYYEGGPKVKAFNNRLSFDGWKQFAEIKNCYDDILFTAPIIAVNVSHCMLQRLLTEAQDGGHKFVFFCAHDTTILSALSALQVEDYSLPGTIESKTPIGFKFLIEQWSDDSGERYVRARLVYQSTAQIRNMETLDLENPPMSYELSFAGMEKTPGGFYRYDDFLRHLEASVNAFTATARGENPFK